MTKLVEVVHDIIYHPNQRLSTMVLKRGDKFIVNDTEEMELGSKYKGFDNLMVTQIYYKPKKWWEFWKPRKINGYEVECIRD